MTDCICGIDIGGTSVKVMICDIQENILSFEKTSTLSAYKNIDGKTLDTGPQRAFDGEILWEITEKTIRRAMLNLASDCHVYSVAVSSCGCTVILLDKNGRQIDLIVSEEQLLEEISIYRKYYTPDVFQKCTGYPMEKENSGFHLSAFCQTEDGKRIARVLSVDDYILWKLCGKPVRNFSTAVSCGMWDRGKNSWMEFFLERSGLDEAILGRICESGIVVGPVLDEVSKNTGLSKETVVCTGGHDYECAAFACHTLVKNNIFNITGTVDLIATFAQEGKDIKKEEVRHISDKHVIPGYQSNMLEVIGAAQTEWLKNNVVAQASNGFSLTWESYFKQVEKYYNEQIYTTELFIPKIFGTLIPKINSQTYGVFSGLNEKTDSVSLLRAVMEGMALQNRRMLEWIKDDAVNQQRLVIVGGISRNPVWLQMKADILNLDIVSPQTNEASALGAALLGGVGCGLYEGYEQAANVSDGMAVQIYKPQYERVQYYNEIYSEIFLPMEHILEEYDKKRVQINRERRKL